MRAALVLSCMILFSCSKQSTESPLTQLLNRNAEYNEQKNPSEDSVYNRLPSMAPEVFEDRYNFNQELLSDLGAIDRSALSPSDQISYDLFKFIKENEAREYEFKTHLNPLLVDYGFHIGFVFTAQSYQFDSKDSYQHYMDLLMDFPRYVNENIALLKKGLELEISQSQIIFDGYEITYDNHIVDDPTTSLFYQPFVNLPDSFTDEEKENLRKKAVDAVTDGAVKGYQLFSEFMTNEYIPKTRTNIGASNLPDGDLYYEYLIKKFTTLNLKPDSVHNLGLSEVARIKGEMLEIINKTGFEGSFSDFLQFLRTDERFYAKTPGELLREASYISKKMDGVLPKLFGRLPRQPYTVNPVPDHLAPKYTGGRYVGADISSTNPGQYWVNTYALENRPLYVLEALSFHEAVPGHHLQGSLTQELDLPDFRKNLYLSAFGEGWGLYSEFLGKEAGFYADPYSDFGRLTYEMWRACRLVVDTGIHSFGWTREEAMEYMAANTALSLHEVRTEVDRYISWPGQALSYKIGELKIKALRKKAESTLGDDFDVREFHDLVLSEGTVTLPILEEMVNRYLEEINIE
ncbi:MAG: DUF885 domain-containing protein [Cyclobacteriaceae bacterium]